MEKQVILSEAAMAVLLNNTIDGVEDLINDMVSSRPVGNIYIATAAEMQAIYDDINMNFGRK